MGSKTIALIVTSVVLFLSVLYLIGHRTGLHHLYASNEALYKDVESAAIRTGIEKDLVRIFGTAEDPKMPSGMGINSADLRNGRDFYRRQCLHCHGVSGDGAGTTAPFIYPRPRDYRRGVFKIRSTVGDGAKPTREDLLLTLKNGMLGSMMPSFSLFDDATLGTAVDYVIHLSMRGELEQKLVIQHEGEEEYDPDLADSTVASIVKAWQDAPGQVAGPKTSRPAPTPESIARGRELFQAQGKGTPCSACHGVYGKGDGPYADSYQDEWNPELKIRPADLTQGVYRGGRRPIDLWRRIHIGIPGTPMPGSAGSMSDEDIWHIVNYLQSIVETGAPNR